MLYAVHPSVAYAQSIVRNLEQKTGRSLEAWLALLEKEDLPGVKTRRDWLKTTHGLGSTTASMIAERSIGGGLENTDEAAYLAAAPGYVEGMFRGKEALRPIYNRLAEAALALWPELRICPCQTIVPFYRHHVFAHIRPAAKTRLELGLCLKNVAIPLPARLKETGGLAKGDRITHRFDLAPGDLPDAEMLHWLQVAYELDADK